MQRLKSVGSIAESALPPNTKNFSQKKFIKSMSEQLREEREKLFSPPKKRGPRKRRNL